MTRARRPCVITGGAGLAAACACAIAVSSATASAGPGMLQANPPVQVIPVAVPGGATGSTQLVNSGASDLTVGSVVRDGTCAAAVTAAPAGGAPPFIVTAGGMKTMNLTCAASVPPGIDRCMFHVGGSIGQPLLDFEAACEYSGAATLAASSSSLVFGSVAVGQAAATTISITNQAATTIERLSFHIDDLDGNFRLAAPCNPDARACDAPIADVMLGLTTPVTVVCTPQSVGTHTARLYIASDTGQHLPGSPDAIDLSCDGTSPTDPVISVGPGPVDVGAVEVIGTSASSILHVRNVGASPLQITDVTIIDAGTGAASDWTYSASNACTGSIAPACQLSPGQQVDLDVTFDPSAIAVREATLLISYTDTGPRSTSVPLRGVGRGATLELVGAHPAIDFGTVPIGGMAQVTVQLENRGNRDLTDVALDTMPATGTPFTLSASTLTIAAGASSPITVTCKPTAAGPFSAAVTASAPDAFAGSPITITVSCTGSSMPLTSNPTTIVRGDIRTDSSPGASSIMLLSSAGALTVNSIALESSSAALSLTGAATPVSTPTTIQLTVDPTNVGDFDNAIVVMASNGDTLRIPITGRVVSAAAPPPSVAALGTFCVNQPTTPGLVTLATTGTGSVRLISAMLEQGASSPFDVVAVSPPDYPATLDASGIAIVEVTPRRQSVAQSYSDTLVWSTDPVAVPATRTLVGATFLENGGAIAPSMLAFGKVPIHLETKDAQTVTLQNCDVTALDLDPPQISRPFTIDSPNFPTTLAPNERATFSVGYHPTRAGVHEATLTIGSPQLPADMPFTVQLSGEGIVISDEPDAGVVVKQPDSTSFYACSGCSTKQPASGIVLVLAIGYTLRRRRR